ncbi:hypothetical protein CB1_000552021 [Camelus ferus]|nr:hypothetical protein CB1_000552021 [Camelus ferus]
MSQNNSVLFMCAGKHCGYVSYKVIMLTVSFSVTMSDRKAVIKNADMSEDMQQDAVDCATQAMEKYNIEKDIAAYIKKCSLIPFGVMWYEVCEEAKQGGQSSRVGSIAGLRVEGCCPFIAMAGCI